MDNGLYIHIPFCEKKCNYCNFYSVTADKALKTRYVDALINEAEIRLGSADIATVYVGGGTPTCLDDGELTRIFDNIDISNIREFTVEANPNSLTDAKIEEYLKLGVTRISLGVQSLDDRCLKIIGRLHNAETAINRIKKLKTTGLDINVDYMVGLPCQSVGAVEKEIDRLCSLGINHLSCYGLIVEDGTPLREMIDARAILMPDEDTSVDMYDAAMRIAKKYGLQRYEISNFGKPCQHNMIYWRLNYYVGLGAAAHSFIDGAHSYNAADIDEFIKFYSNHSSAEKFSDNKIHNAKIGKQTALNAMHIDKTEPIDILREYVMLGLRLDKGADIDDLKTRFGEESARNVLNACEACRKYLNIDTKSVAVMPEYTYISNGITADIIFGFDS